MGSIYQRSEFHCKTCKRRLRKTTEREACRAAGHTIEKRQGSIYWLKYTRAGKSYNESSETTKKRKAESLLKRREGDIERGIAVSPKVDRVTFEDAAGDLLNDYRINRKRSEVVAERRVEKHLKPFFAGYRLVNITTDRVRAYIAHRQEQGIVNRKTGVRRGDVSNAEINRELSLLRRMFTLAVQAGKLFHKPHVPMLAESPARAGFFEPEQLSSVLRHLSAEIRPVIQFAAETGWRIASEVLPLEWRNVDFNAGEVRLDAGTTKNGEGRVFPLTGNLRAILESQRTEHERLKKAGHICPTVFFREVAEERGGEKKPQPVVSFTKAWKKATKAVGCPGRIPHDLRRTAIRRFVREGITERAAMQLSGHKTRSVFDRYDIVSGSDLRDAARKLDAAQRRDAKRAAATANSYGLATVGQKSARRRQATRKIS